MMSGVNEGIRRIYAQGDLDGACFLYSVVNAYVALTRREPEFSNVCSAFKQVDHPQDFLSGNTGTNGQYCNRPDALKDNIERILSVIGNEKFAVTVLDSFCFVSGIESYLDQNSVVLLHYLGNSKFAKNLDHWVCAVEYKESILYVACSVRLQKACKGGTCDYQEIYHRQFERWSNDQLFDGNDQFIMPTPAIQVSLVSRYLT